MSEVSDRPLAIEHAPGRAAAAVREQTARQRRTRTAALVLIGLVAAALPLSGSPRSSCGRSSIRTSRTTGSTSWSSGSSALSRSASATRRVRRRTGEATHASCCSPSRSWRREGSSGSTRWGRRPSCSPRSTRDSRSRFRSACSSPPSSRRIGVRRRPPGRREAL